MAMKYGFNKQELIAHMHRDIRLVLAFYIGDEIDLAVPDMHVEIWDELVSLMEETHDPHRVVPVLKKLLAIPRGHAKTTLIKLAVLLLLRFGRLSFCAYVSNTAPVAYNALLDIESWFLSANDQDLYGASKTLRKTTAESLIIMDIAMPGGQPPKRILMKAFGQGTQIRGTIINNRRPDLLIFDDIESRETVDSELQQQRLDAWATGTAMKSMAKRGVVIFIGNMLGKTSLLARLSKAKEWNATVLGSIIKLKDGSYAPLWPGMWTLDQLVTDYLSYVQIGIGHIWAAEMMNLTSEDILGESLANALRPFEPTPDEVDAGFICLDPAFGQKAWNDFSAITVHVRKHRTIESTAMEMTPMLARVITTKGSAEQLCQLMLEQTYYWGLTTWVIESVAAQRLLIPLFSVYLQAQGIMPGVISLMPITGGRESKASRIVAFRQSVASGSYGICESLEDFKDKLEKYTPLSTDHDDDLDSGAYGPIAWSLLGATIQTRGVGMQVLGHLLGSAGDGGDSSGDIHSAVP